MSPPAPGHNPLEIMTKQDYSKDVLAAPTGNLLVGKFDAPPPSINFFMNGDSNEIAKFTEEGFYYKGEFVDDAGEVHRLMKDVLNGICYKHLCEELLGIFEKYDDESNLAGIYWDMEKEGNDLFDRARAALNP